MCSTTLYSFDRPKDQRKGQIGTCEETGEETLEDLLPSLDREWSAATYTLSLVGMISMRKPRKATLDPTHPYLSEI